MLYYKHKHAVYNKCVLCAAVNMNKSFSHFHFNDIFVTRYVILAHI